MNLFTDIIPAPARKYLYAAYALAGMIVGALAVAGVDIGKAPDVIAYLAIPLGITAASNTAPTPRTATAVVNVHSTPGMDESEIARTVSDQLKWRLGDPE